MSLPVFVKPVVDGGFEVNMLTKVSRTCGRNKKFGFFRHGMSVIATRLVGVDFAESKRHPR